MPAVPSDEEFLAYDQGVQGRRPRHPAWFHDLRADPRVTVELGGSSFDAEAVVTAGAERERLYRKVAGAGNEYEKNTDRVFPVVVLAGVSTPS